MKRFSLCALFVGAAFLSACGAKKPMPVTTDDAGTTDGANDPCAQVHCSQPHEVCNPADLMCHCMVPTGPQCTGDTPLCGADATCHSMPNFPMVCNAGEKWSSGTQAFRESTAAWGLTDLAVGGTQFSVSDVNNDGWPDLAVRNGPTRNDLAPGGSRTNWLLVNHGGHFSDETVDSGVLQNRAVTVPFEIPIVDAGPADSGPSSDAGVAADGSTSSDAAVAPDASAIDGGVAPDSGTVDAGTTDADVDAHVPVYDRPAQVWAFGDVDNDGDDDVYTGVTDPAGSTDYFGQTSELLLNDGTNHFTLSSASNGIRRVGVIDTSSGASFVDFNHDGNLDLWITQFGWSDSTSLNFIESQLYQGDGHGNFVDVTGTVGPMTYDYDTFAHINAGLSDTRSWGGLACDANNDGWVDLFSASYGRAPNGFYQASASSTGAVTYTNRSVASGYAFDMNMSYNTDQNFACWCSHEPNASMPACAGVASPLIQCSTPDSWSSVTDVMPYRTGGNSGTTACADMDNDGDMDLITSEIKHWWAGDGADHAEILVNNGMHDVVFDRPGREAMGIDVPHTYQDYDEGIMTNAAFDFDNDGWRDFYLGGSDYPNNRGMLFHSTGGGLHFESVSITDGIDQHRSQGIVFADFDRDGDLDVIVGHSHARCSAGYNPPGEPDTAACYPTNQIRLFENLIGNHGNWIQLDLEGAAGTNRDAIGARVTVTTAATTQTFEVNGTYGQFGHEDERVVHVGLGTECMAEVDIRWPNAAQTTEVFFVVSGHRYHVTQGMAPVIEAAAMSSSSM